MTRYWVAIAAVCLGAAAGIGAAGCGGDDSGDTNSITVPSIETEIRTSPAPSTTPTDEGLPTTPDHAERHHDAAEGDDAEPRRFQQRRRWLGRAELQQLLQAVPGRLRRLAAESLPLPLLYGLRRLFRGDRIGVSVHELPLAVLATKNARDA